MRYPKSLRVFSTFIAGVLALVPAAPGQTSELTQYTNAVAHVQPSERVILLERFAIYAKSTPLKIDALEYVVWEYLRTHNTAHAVAWAAPLADADPNNPVALAMQSYQMREAVEKGQGKPERLLTLANRGLDGFSALRRPLGMKETDFTLFRRQVNAMLSGAAGTAELHMKDYVAARTYLHNAVSVDANSVQDIYALALADLSGPNKNMREGYWYLARAVNLAQGTPQGMEMARYARARYVKDGGSTTDWNDYLASAKPSGDVRQQSVYTALAALNPPPPTPARPAQKAAQPLTTASVKPPAPAKPGKPQPVITASAKPPAVAKPANPQPAPSVWADTTSAPIVRKRRTPSTVGPMSLGILVETSLATKENRSAVVNSLIDMLRHMGEQDEAFILTYDNNLVFEQDLTTDPHQLEEAMGNIKPQKGAVLDDAIAFAAGHLARIAKYPNRILLVVSDGKNIDSQGSPLQTSAEINAAGVRIFCIGLDVTGLEGRYRLQALASSTGGQSSFISSPGQFRNATRDIAQNMGIDFRF